MIGGSRLGSQGVLRRRSRPDDGGGWGGVCVGWVVVGGVGGVMGKGVGRGKAGDTREAELV